MTSAPRPDIATLALEELARRRDNARRAIAACSMTVADAERRLTCYAALAAYAGARLPDDIAAQIRGPADDMPVAWWEFVPRGTDPAAFLRTAREELQRATVEAMQRHERAPTDATLTRARNLIALYDALARDALGPLPLAPRRDPAAADQVRRAA